MTSINTNINITEGESIDNFISIIEANASFSFEPYTVSVRGRDLKGVFKHNSPDTSNVWKALSGTGYKNVLFVVKKAKLPSGTHVCTFPSFLSSEYSRTCRTAFEGLKNTMKLIIPSGEPLAFGIGHNTKDEHDNLHGSGLNLRIGDVNVIIRKLK